MRQRFFIFIIIGAAIAGLFVFRESRLMRNMRERAFGLIAPLLEASFEIRRSVTFWFAEESSFSPLDARIQDAQIESLRRENKDLRALLDFQESEAFRLINARVLFYGKDAGKEFLIINRGSRDGVRSGDHVMTRDILLLGRIEKINTSFSHVIIASNAGEIYEGELFPLGARTLAKGAGGRAFELEFIASNDPVHPGDIVRFVLRGAPPIFLSEVVHAQKEISSAFQRVRASLLARPERAEEVIIITQHEPL